jgi:hypothetical protein
VIAACGGGGGSNDPEPTLRSGQVDGTYGTGGRVALSGFVNDVKVLPDGSVYVVGVSGIHKLDSRGVAVSEGEFNTVALNPSSTPATLATSGGEIYVGSSSGVRKYDATGRLVTSWGMNGIANHGLAGAFTDVFGLARDPADNLYVAFITFDGAPAFIAKFDRSGRLVASYGGSGAGLAHPGLGMPFGQELAADSTGALYVSGTIRGTTASSLLPAIAKVDPDGRISANFGAGGMWSRDGCEAATPPPIEVDEAGNLLVAVNCLLNNAMSTRLMKLDSAGVPITSFRQGGTRPGLLGGTSGTEYAGTAHGLLSRPGGVSYFDGIAAAGAFGCSDFAVVGKLDLAGAPESDFATGGVIRFTQSWPIARIAGVDGSGRLYVLVVTRDACSTRPTLAFALHRFGG